MNTDFQIYLNEQAIALEEFRQKKKKAYNRYKNTIGILIKILKITSILIIPVCIFIPPLWLVFLGELILIGFLSRVPNPKEVYEDHYKKKVLPKIFKKINPTFEYLPYCSNKDNLEKSGILKSSYLKANSKIISEDFIKGKINQTDIECNELHFYRIEKNWVKYIFLFLSAFIVYPLIFIFCIVTGTEIESVGWLSLANEEKLYYRGFLMVSDFHKSLNGELVMIPKSQKQMADRLNLNMDTRYYKKIQLENPVVNDLYDIYTRSEQEGFYILSPSMLQAIEELNIANQNRNPMITFANEKMSIFIPKKHNSFEVNLEEGISGDTHFLKHIKDVMVLPKLVDHFKLEDQLWTK